MSTPPSPAADHRSRTFLSPSRSVSPQPTGLDDRFATDLPEATPMKPTSQQVGVTRRQLDIDQPPVPDGLGAGVASGQDVDSSDEADTATEVHGSTHVTDDLQVITEPVVTTVVTAVTPEASTAMAGGRTPDAAVDISNAVTPPMSSNLSPPATAAAAPTREPVAAEIPVAAEMPAALAPPPTEAVDSSTVTTNATPGVVTPLATPETVTPSVPPAPAVGFTMWAIVGAILVLLLAGVFHTITALPGLSPKHQLAISSSPDALRPSAEWVKQLASGTSLQLFTEFYDDELDTVTCTAFPSGEVLSRDCKAAADEQLNRGIVLVERLSSTEDTSRNVIGTTKNNWKQGWREERYKTVLQTAKWVTFVVEGLPCAGIRDAVKMPAGTDLVSCNSQPEFRKQWFGYFAQSYGVEGGGLPATTCFVDVVELELAARDRNEVTDRQDNTLCTTAVSYVLEKGHVESSRLAASPLSQTQRDEFRLKIQEALKAKPADTIETCWIPDGIAVWLPYSLLSKVQACAKRAYLLKTYPQFHIGVFGGHGVGKSTFLHWLGFYAKANILNSDVLNGNFAAVCPAGGDSCTDMYVREMLSPTHYFYDSKGLQQVGEQTAKYVSLTATGKGVPVDCEMLSEEVRSKLAQEAATFTWWDSLMCFTGSALYGVCVAGIVVWLGVAKMELVHPFPGMDINIIGGLSSLGTALAVTQTALDGSIIGAAAFLAALAPCAIGVGSRVGCKFKGWDPKEIFFSSRNEDEMNSIGLFSVVGAGTLVASAVTGGDILGVMSVNAALTTSLFGVYYAWWKKEHPVEALKDFLPIDDIGVISGLGLVTLGANVVAGGPAIRVVVFIAALALGDFGVRSWVKDELPFSWPDVSVSVAGFVGLASSTTAFVLFASIVSGGSATVNLTIFAASTVCLYCTIISMGLYPAPTLGIAIWEHFYKAAALGSGCGALVVYAHIATDGSIWGTVFGKTLVGWVWTSSATHGLGWAAVSVALQTVVAIGALEVFRSFKLLDTPKWLTAAVVAVILTSKIAFSVGELKQTTAFLGPSERCFEDNGRYPALELLEEKRDSSVHSVAILGKYPNPDSTDIENMKGLKRGLTDGLRASGIMVSYGVTVNTACGEPSLPDCLQTYERLHTIPQGRTAMLDGVLLTGLSRQQLPEEYDEVIKKTYPAFLEPDRVLTMLELMQTQARVFYRAEANRKSKTGFTNDTPSIPIANASIVNTNRDVEKSKPSLFVFTVGVIIAAVAALAAHAGAHPRRSKTKKN